MHPSSEWTDYWNRIHRDCGSDRERDPHALQAVITPQASRIYNRAVDCMQRMHLERAFKPLEPWVNKDVLEIGCGGGRWCETLARRGARVTGVDHSLAAVEANRLTQSLAGIRFECGPATRLDFPPACFDVVLSVTVLQHVPHEEQRVAIREGSRVLQPGGHFLAVEMIDEATPDAEVLQQGDLFCRSSGAWRSMFEAAGLELVQSSRHALMPLTRIYVAAAQAWVESLIRRHPSTALPQDESRGSPTPVALAWDDAETRSAPGRWPSWVHKLHHLAWDAINAASVIATFPIEWIANRFLERRLSNHVSMLYRKPL